MKLSEQIQAVPYMNDNTLILAIRNENVLVRVRAICEAVNRGLSSEDAIEAMKDCKRDNRPFWNHYLVNMFAEAALACLGAEDYNGGNPETKELIKQGLRFFDEE